ncbi:MAG: hypothetical protein QG665_167 [Patescibacteria group bacterium]|nr:hypothetical protein [Patescibacteria group bacterium]
MGMSVGCIDPRKLKVEENLLKGDRLPRAGDSFVFFHDKHRVFVVRRKIEGLVVIFSADFDGLTHQGFLNYVRQQEFLLGKKFEKSQLAFSDQCVAYDIR